MITVAIADNSSIVRNNMRALLEIESDLCIVGEAADELEAIRLVECLKPNVLVVDLAIGDMNGIELIKQVSKRSPGTSVVVFSMHTEAAYVVESLRLGAKAYVTKDSNSDELVRAIRQVAIGQHHLSPPFSEESIETYGEKASNTSEEK
jgi:DNA-binding NarL/FixJ family response regulator